MGKAQLPKQISKCRFCRADVAEQIAQANITKQILQHRLFKADFRKFLFIWQSKILRSCFLNIFFSMPKQLWHFCLYQNVLFRFTFICVSQSSGYITSGHEPPTPTIQTPMLWIRKWRPLLHSNDAQWHSSQCTLCTSRIDAQGLTTRNYVWYLARYANCMKPRE